MRFKYHLIFLCLVFSQLAISQENHTLSKEFGVEIQQYPTGFLLGLRFNFGLKAHHRLNLRAGYNTLDHKDFGVQDSEIGGGFGGSLGYNYYFSPLCDKFFIGVRSDLWFNEIDWKNEVSGLNGTTGVTVLQPTIIGGYTFILGEKFTLTPTLAFGAEINIRTQGEPVGQGAIILWGVSFTNIL